VTPANILVPDRAHRDGGADTASCADRPDDREAPQVLPERQNDTG
jgi:hypothetical protein